MGRRSKRQGAAVPKRRPRLLIAEPHAGLRRALRTHLEAHFEIVAAAGDGAALDEEVRRAAPDVIVSDLSLLPHVLRWARREKLPPGHAIVGLTSHDAPGLVRRLRWRRLAACVPKWAAASGLTSAIHAALVRSTGSRDGWRTG
jgi:DNA-binding NarL/FixJ family response regulator